MFNKIQYVKQGKDWDRYSGDLLCTMPTELGHIIAHIENAKAYFGIKSVGWGSPSGFGYKSLFPDSVADVVRNIDMKYGLAQESSYRFIEQVEPIYPTEEELVSEWPMWNKDHTKKEVGGAVTIVPEVLYDDERQVQVWVTKFDYLLHDALVSYVYSIGEGEGDKRRKKIEGNSDDELRSIILDLAEWKMNSRIGQQKDRLPKRVAYDENWEDFEIEYQGKTWRIQNEQTD